MSRAARLGAFIVTTLAILAVGTFIIGNTQYLFTSTYRLKAQFSNVVGLDVGAGVRVGGVHRGTVHSIELPHRPGDKITVVMDLDSTNARHHQARLRSVNRNRGPAGQRVYGDLVWNCRGGQRARR